jgi:hypothetical protein
MTINAIGRVAAAAAIAAIVTIGMPSAVFADPVAAPAKPAAQAKPTRYCVVDHLTGSRIAHKTCKTREQWIKEDGFDPTKK